MDDQPTPRPAPAGPDRRAWLAGLGATALAGCIPAGEPGETFGSLDAVWGVHGIVEGRMHKPRAMTIDPSDRLYLIDFTARVLVYDADGSFLRGWRTPESTAGRPTGVSYDPHRNQVLVADTHYYRVLCYTPEGEPVPDGTIGGVHGAGPGEFGFVTDAVRAADGRLYVSEYGENDRVQVFGPDGGYLHQWGSHGDGPNQFKRPQCLALDPGGRLWVCDSCNHRLTAFSPDGELLQSWGAEGAAVGDLYYPYGMAFAPDGTLVVAEYGNHRLQRFTPEGESLGVWGGHGAQPGRLWGPWAVVCDSRGRLHVLDTQNHRVQRVRV